MKNIKCPICETEGCEDKGGNNFECPRCGSFSADGRSGDERNNAIRIETSGWIRHQNEAGNKPTLINTETIKQIKAMPFPSVAQRIEWLLEYAIEKSNFMGHHFNIPKDFIAYTYSKNLEEVKNLKNYLTDERFFRFFEKAYDKKGTLIEVTSKGYMEDEKRRTARKVSTQCFIAMSFSEKMNNAENAIKTAISNAGYKAYIVKDKHYLGKICDEIIAEIRKSKFVVADYTEHKGGVYFEAGFAMGLNLPVIPTVHKDDVEKLHFDTRQYNTIIWKDESDLQKQLKDRIEAVIGVGSIPQENPKPKK